MDYFILYFILFCNLQLKKKIRRTRKIKTFDANPNVNGFVALDNTLETQLHHHPRDTENYVKLSLLANLN